MVVIADMAEYERVLVDGLKNFPRVLMPLRRLTLTKLRLPLLRGARTGTIVKAAKENGNTISANGSFFDYFTIHGTTDTHCFHFHAYKGVVTCAEKMSLEETAERIEAERKGKEEYAATPLRQCPTCLEWKKDFAIGGACFSCPSIEPRFITIETGVFYDDFME